MGTNLGARSADRAATELKQGPLQPVEASVHLGEASLHSPFKQVEALAGVCCEAVQPGVGPALSHGVHDCTVEIAASRVARKIKNFCNIS